jgi:hemerythrin
VMLGLLDYTRTHFAAEERLMLLHAYPDYDRHRAAHEGLAGRVAGLFAKFQQGEPVITLQLAKFLRDWLTDHILGMDKELGAYLTRWPIAAPGGQDEQVVA